MLTPKQLEQRRKGITATDASAIVGENPWRRPIDVYLSKKGIDQPRSAESEERALTGSILEEGLAQRYVLKAKPADRDWRIFEPKQTLVNPQMPWVMATPDRFVFDMPAGQGDELGKVAMKHASRAYPAECSHLLECKLVGRPVQHWDLRSADSADEDRLPVYVYVQVQWQAIVTGVQRVDVAALLNGTGFRVFHVPVNHEYCKNLLDICYKFMVDHVLADVAPDPDGSGSYSRYLSDLCPRNLVDVVDPSEDAALAELVTNYDAARAVESAAKKDKEHFAQLLKAVVLDRAGFIGQWGKVTWLTSAGQVDYKRLIEDLAVDSATLDKYRTPTRTLRVTAKKDKV